MSQPRRPYDSSRRRARADSTRAGIAEAARELLIERGWTGTTVRDVAQRAGVSEPTVYTAYGSKAGLASALVDAVAARADHDRQGRELAASEGDPGGQLTAMIGFDVRLYEHGGDVLAALRDAGRSHPDLTTAYAEGRAAGDRLRAEVLRGWPRGALRAGLKRADAIDVYAAVCNIDVYRELTGRGWSPRRVERWLHDSLRRLLLA